MASARKGGGRTQRLIRSLPAPTQVGIALVVIGLAIDAAYHLMDPEAGLATPCCGPGFAGHLTTLAGMVVALVGTVTFAVRRKSGSTVPREGGHRARADLSV